MKTVDFTAMKDGTREEYLFLKPLEDEHIKARENLVEMHDPREGKVVVPNVLPRLSETPGTIRSLGPDLGQHNDDVFGGLLELPADELRRLREQKII